jgi:predicted nucleic acid-binding protein
VNLVDTSVWIEVLRGTESTATARVHDLVAEDAASIATTEPIIMELIAGAAATTGLDAVDRLTASMVLVGVDPATDFHHAGHLYRAARARGLTVRKLADCLIAAVAIRVDATLWHRDADFEALASISPLSTVDLR